MSRTLSASYILDNTRLKGGVSEAAGQFAVLDAKGAALGAGIDASTSKMGKGFQMLGGTLGTFGLPFTGFLTDAGTKLDRFKTSGKGAVDVLSSVGKVATAVTVGGLAAVAGESIHVAMGFQAAAASFAGSADISVTKANSIGNAFLGMGGHTIYSGTQMLQALNPVAGQLSTLQGKVLTTSQYVGFMSTASTLAEATGGDLANTTKDLANVMQAFQVPVKGAAKVTDELYSTSRLTGVGLDSLVSTTDRLKSRLGIAAPTIGDMSTMLVDLAEHGVSGSKGLLVVNTAITKLLTSTTNVDKATAKAADTYSTKMASAQLAVTKASDALSAAQGRAGASATTAALSATAATQSQSIAQQNAVDAVNKAETALADKQQLIAQANAVYQAKVASGTMTAAQAASAAAGQQKAQLTDQISLQNLQSSVSAAQGRAAQLSATQQTQGTLAANRALGTQTSSTGTLTAAQQRLADAQAKVAALQATGGASTNASVQAMQALGLHVYDTAGKFVGMGSVIGQLEPKLKTMTQQQQLAALASVFGSSANKALLATVLAGPAAYDRAQAAVMRHNSATQAAEKLNQTFARQVEIVKTQVIDLSTKFGNYLIPKLQMAGKAVGDVIHWFEKHKTVAEGLGIAIAVGLGIPMTIFAVTTLGKMVKGLKDTGNSILHLGDTFGKASGKTVEAAGTNDKLNQTLKQLDKSLGLVAEKLPGLDKGFSSLMNVERSQIEVNASIAESNRVLASTYATVEEAQISLAAAAPEVVVAEEEIGAGASTMLGPIGIAIMGIVAVGTLLITHWKAISHDISVVWHDVFNFGKRIFGDLEQFFKKWGEDILLVFAPIVGIPLFLATHWRQVESDAKAIWGHVVSFFKGIPGEIMSVFADAGKWLFDVGKKVIAGLWTGFETVDPIGIVIKYRTRILNALADAAIWLFDTGKSVITGLWNGADSMASWIGGKLLAVGTWVITALAKAGTWLVDTGVNALKGLWDGFTSVTGWLTDKLGRIPVWIWDALKDAGKWLLDTGINIIHGLFNGISSMSQWLWDKITGFVRSFIENPIKSFFGIHSPSTLMFGHGAFIGMGLANGMFSTSSQVTAASKALATAANAGIADATLTAAQGATRTSATALLNAMPTAPSTTAAAAQQQPSGGLTIIIQGNVLDGRQFADLVHRALLEKATVNGTLLGVNT